MAAPNGLGTHPIPPPPKSPPPPPPKGSNPPPPPNTPSVWGRIFSAFKAGGDRVANVFGDRGNYYNVTKIGGKVLVIFKAMGYHIPPKMGNAFSIFMDYNDATRIPENYFYLFSSRVYGKGPAAAPEGLKVDWRQSKYGTVFGRISLAAADTMSTISFLHYVNLINTAQIAQSLGGFRILGVAVFAVVKKVSLEAVSRGTVVGAMIFFVGQSSKEFYDGWKRYYGGAANDPARAQGVKKMRESVVGIVGSVSESMAQILWFANVSSGTGTVVICLFSIGSAVSSIVRNQM